LKDEERRSAGAGSVDQLPSGRWRVRVTLSDETRRSLGVYDTQEEAQGVLNAALRKLAAGQAAPVGGITLRAWGERWLTEREISGEVRAIRTDWGRWRTHVETAPFADWPLVSITPRDVYDWAQTLKKKLSATPHRVQKHLSRKTVKEIVSLLRLALDAAVAPAGILRENPAKGIRVKRERRTHEPWTYLLPEEQRALLTCEKIPEADRMIIAFAIGTGLREGEQFNARLEDLVLEGDAPHIWVRYGSAKAAPKNGKIRKVPLFGLGLAAARRWLEILPSYAPKNPLGLLFPGAYGGRRPVGKNLHTTRTIDKKPRKVDVYHEHLTTAGIVPEKRHDRQRPRWHDLRHTCASSLVAGWWGRRWSLEEVKELLGHSSIMITQRYTHLAESALTAAAKGTSGGGEEGGNDAKVTRRSRAPQTHDITGESQELLTRRSRVRVPVDPPLIYLESLAIPPSDPTCSSISPRTG
jgi:integrase